MPVTSLSLTGRRWTERLSLGGELLEMNALTAALRAHRQIDRSGAKFSLQEMKDLPRAIDRLQEAVQKKERIAIFGDYDCDGITSTALLTRMLRRRGVQPYLRLPHRLREGYGLKMPVIDELVGERVTLLLTADTGISSIAEIAHAKQKGIDTIVIDHHHLPAAGLPDAIALLHPSLLPSPPASPPAAAGVAWSVIEAFEASEGKTDWEDKDTDLALAMIGTVADLVELRDGNRDLVLQGLAAFKRIDKGPLALLKMQAGVGEHPKSTDIAFRIAPRINAAGRMADPSIALDALLGNELAVLQLEDWNRERQTLVGSLVEEAVEKATNEGAMICLADPRYVPGICGLIAGKLTDRLGRPSLVAYRGFDGLCTASLRSVPRYNVTEGLESAQDLLRSFGGHAMAAGCTFESTRFGELRERLSADVLKNIDVSALVPSLAFDAALDARHVSLDLCRTLQSLEPFGQGNPEPSFLLPGVRLTDVRKVGKDALHLQARLGASKIIGFHLGHLAEHTTQPIDLLAHIGIDSWQGALKPQLYLQDIRPVNVGVRHQ